MMDTMERAVGINWHAFAHVDKYDDEQAEWVKNKAGLLHRPVQGNDFIAAGVKPIDIAECESNLLTTAGLTRITALITATGGLQALINTSTRLGTGNGAGGAAIGDTDLGATAGSANRWYQIMDATFPSASAGVISAKASWASGDGNYAWNEWGLDVGAPTVASSAVVGACFVNHKTSAALGTKTSGIWALTVTITLS